ncbi:hypothetical protein [Cellulomonas chengniuliangii]|uniref:Integral membrane protein n=1 Tax=Cellulomonas chengniuliangii TaxID=2968084 RepID=A0ABY5KY18_9CELL|nr:hypothetical protein [Cellulomonas chengniuliangii]MCC2307835.1 hypothetical protein [Cellulomonas chengniuliangii]UUI75410.1 hypothetical protein NP064_00300 [Cellulomonas chengniuliangii]
MSAPAPGTSSASLVAAFAWTAVLAVGTSVLSATRWHSFLWREHHADAEVFSTMRARGAELGLPLLDASLAPRPPGVWASTVIGVSDGLTVAAVALLGVALVAAGHRLWGLLAPVLLNIVPLVAGWPLLGAVVLPGADDPSGGPLPWWAAPLLIGIATSAPAAAAAAAGPGHTPDAATARACPRAVLLRAGLATVLVLGGSMAWSWAVGATTQPWGESLAQHTSTAIVILSTALVAAALPGPRLRRWAAVGVLLVVLDGVLASGVLTGLPAGQALSAGIEDPLARAMALAIGPLAVLAPPAVGRVWRAAFRREQDASAAPGPA